MSYPTRWWQGGRRESFAALEAMQERMNRFFGDALSGYRGRTPSWHPDIDLEETDDGWVLEVRLPGVAPDEVSIDVSDRELLIRSASGAEQGQQQDEVEAEERPMTARSRRWTRFSYRLSIPSEVDADHVDATMDHGLLTVHLPRSTEPRSRRIAVGRQSEVTGGRPQVTTGGEQRAAPERPSDVVEGETASGQSERPMQ